MSGSEVCWRGEKEAFISQRDGIREYARNVAQTEYLSGKKKASQINKKGDFESGSLAGKMSGEGSPCRQVVGDDALTRLP